MKLDKLFRSKKIILFDGGMGTEIIKKGLDPGNVPDLFNITRPEVVKEIHANYFKYSDMVQTCTFSANSLCLDRHNLSDVLDQINTKALQNIQEVRPKGKLIVGNIGPSGEFREPVGEMSSEQWEQGFFTQVKILEPGIDIYHIETISDILEMEAAIKAIKQVSDKPIIASMTYRKTKRGFFTLMGDSPASSIEILEKNKVDVIGTNCTIGSDEMIDLSEEIVSLTNLPVLVKPNAGRPRLEYKSGHTHYDQKTEDFGKDIQKMIDHGAKIVGGCCGTTPEHINLLRKIIDTIDN